VVAPPKLLTQRKEGSKIKKKLAFLGALKGPLAGKNEVNLLRTTIKMREKTFPNQEGEIWGKTQSGIKIFLAF